MAQIVLGLGTSHTPMLLVDASDLPRYEENDRRLPLLDVNGASITFDRLLVDAANDHVQAVAADPSSARHAAAQRAITGLSDALASAALDTLIVIGDDQKEMLRGDHHPPLLVYARPTIRGECPPHMAGRPEWVLRGTDRYYPADGPQDYPVAQALAQHLIGHLEKQEFEVAAAAFGSDDVPMGHAFAFVHSQLMRDQPIPAAGALRSLRIERIDYIPGYRTRAGTGTGLCFAIWR